MKNVSSSGGTEAPLLAKGPSRFYGQIVLITIFKMPALWAKLQSQIVLILHSYVHYKFTDIKSARVMNLHVLSSKIMKI